MPEFAHLLNGYKRFRDGDYSRQKERYDALATDGQAPPVMIISCCDSRVDPATIFDTVAGQIFALRNVANLVPPYIVDGGHQSASAAIEFAVTALKVRHIVVLGHGLCGGIAAVLDGHSHGKDGQPSFIDKWMNIAKDVRDRVVASAPTDPQRTLEHEAIKLSLDNLRSFPFVAKAEQEGRLKLHGAWFAIGEGALHVLSEDSGTFQPA